MMMTPEIKAKAEQMCSEQLYGGHLVEIDSVEEMDMIARELVIRHVGEQFAYWAAGNITENLDLITNISESDGNIGKSLR